MGAKNMHVTIVDDVEENLSSYRDLLEDEFELKLIQDPVNLLGFLNIGIETSTGLYGVTFR